MMRQKRFSWRSTTLVLGFMTVLVAQLLGSVGTVQAAGETFTWDPGLGNVTFTDSKVTMSGGDQLPGGLTFNYVVQGTYRTVFTSPSGCQVTAQLEMTVPPTEGTTGKLTFTKPADCADPGFKANLIAPPVIHLPAGPAPPAGTTCIAGHTWDPDLKLCVYLTPNDGCAPGDAVVQGTNSCREGGLFKEPKCAVKGYGRVPCPINIGPGTEKCFVRDPSVNTKPLWVEKGCDSPEFTSPTNVNCGAGANATNCDPAVACATNCDLVAKYVNPGLKAAAALVGIAVTASIIMAGIQYASSGNDPQAVTKAKRRILVGVLSLLGFFLLFAFLNWVIPGGL